MRCIFPSPVANTKLNFISPCDHSDLCFYYFFSFSFIFFLLHFRACEQLYSIFIHILKRAKKKTKIFVIWYTIYRLNTVESTEQFKGWFWLWRRQEILSQKKPKNCINCHVYFIYDLVSDHKSTAIDKSIAKLILIHQSKAIDSCENYDAGR